ncbi:MAG: phenylalanine--tRNA ligase subunit beta [Bacteroidia bacterium]|nr:phenylalanine--tRNA ligase subunit beta [Bacteroidia bacterium]
MKISYNWLKDYIQTDLSYIDIAKILTSIGLEVEAIEAFQPVKGGLEGLIVGKVLSKRKHPNAEKLCLTEVDIGTGEILNIVCGAPNVEAGQKVVVAIPGTTLYQGENSFTIKKTKLRGQLSEGMICAEDEIGIGESHEGIIVLKPDTPIGLSLKNYYNILDDYIFEIGLTPNRIDSASHFGVARDLAVYLQQISPVHLLKPSVDDFKIDNYSLNIQVSVENQEACPRYSGLCITGVEVKESPDWLKNKLLAIGQKPINNIVDITNFVLHETGQPLHAFDADKIKGAKIIVKTLPDNTKFITLDNQERILSAHDLMICNAEEGMCIAGVFGGVESGITENTKNIFLESAYFNPLYIRRTSKRLGILTDSSFRFERGTDINNTVYTLKRAALLFKELAGVKISSEIIDIYPNPVMPKNVTVTFRNINNLAGVSFDINTLKNILNSLDILILEEDNNGMLLGIPPYRVDVTREADVVEEILRIYGYDKVPFSGRVNHAIVNYNKPDKEKLRNSISDFLSCNGFHEIWTNSLSKADYYADSKYFDSNKTVIITNPLSSALNCMRQSLLFSGLETIAYNINRKNHDLKLYEFGFIYSQKNRQNVQEIYEMFDEDEHLALFMLGREKPESWNAQNDDVNFFDIKSIIENIVKRLGFDRNKIEISEIKNEIFTSGLYYMFNSKPIVSFGKVNKNITDAFGFVQEIFYADFHFQEIITMIENFSVRYMEISKFPEVRRDLALLLDREVKYSAVERIALDTENKILKKLFLFDVYEGENLEPGKKSYAVGFILGDPEKTLIDKQIEKTMANIISAFEHELGAKIR